MTKKACNTSNSWDLLELHNLQVEFHKINLRGHKVVLHIKVKLLITRRNSLPENNFTMFQVSEMLIMLVMSSGISQLGLRDYTFITEVCVTN